MTHNVIHSGSAVILREIKLGRLYRTQEFSFNRTFRPTPSDTRPSSTISTTSRFKNEPVSYLGVAARLLPELEPSDRLSCSIFCVYSAISSSIVFISKAR